MGGSETSYPPQQIPAYQSAIGTELLRFIQKNQGGFQASPYDLSYVSPTQRATWSQAQQFGATGLQPYINMLSNMAQNGGIQGSEQALYDVANRDFADRALALRTQAAGSGLSSSSGLTRALAKEQSDISVDLAKQLAGLNENAANRQLQAAQLGLSVIPGALNQLNAIGTSETEPLTRQYNDWMYRMIQAPLAMFGGASGTLQNPGQTTPVVTQSTNWLSQILGIAGQLGAAYLSTL